MSLDDIGKVVDTLVLARMAYTDGFAGRGLEQLEKTLLKTNSGRNMKDRFKAWAKTNRLSQSDAFKKITYDDPVYALYGGWDGILTARLLTPLLAAAKRQLTDHPFGRYGADAAQADHLVGREQKVNRVMLRRSARGLAVDNDRLSAEQHRLIEALSDLDATLREHGVDRPTNPGDLIAVLDKANAIPEDYPRTAKTGKPSTAGDNLLLLQHPVAKAFIAYGNNNRLMNYLESARSIAARTDGRLHPTVGIMKAVTGRMSYSLPALQQFTAAAREMILADEGETLTSIDWSQIEPVIAANLANDFEALEVYESAAGGDLYRVASDAAGVSRKMAKVIILAMMYGEGLASLALKLGVTLEEAAQIRAKVASAIPLTDRLVRWAPEWSRNTGKTWTLSGRVINVDPRFSYRGANYTIQSSGYDLLAETIVQIDEAGMGDQLYLAQHDEVVVASHIAAEVAEMMRTPNPRLCELANRTPLLRVDAAELGDRWRTPDACRSCGSENQVNWIDGWLCASCA